MYLYKAEEEARRRPTMGAKASTSILKNLNYQSLSSLYPTVRTNRKRNSRTCDCVEEDLTVATSIYPGRKATRCWCDRSDRRIPGLLFATIRPEAPKPAELCEAEHAA